ncbi:hypothetical protein BDV93DRAFT_567174 [Ceratobasidium sp. AG-I]|nr:hypothetical protein BDV93DRAFT_567174 [Ceratobasidium sp. AG-I]
MSFPHLRALIFLYADVANILPLLSSTSSSLNLSITLPQLSRLDDDLRVFSGQATVTALHLATVSALPLAIDPLQWHHLHRIIRLCPNLLTLSLQNVPLDDLVAGALRGRIELDVGDAVSSAFPALEAIWLTKCPIGDEQALRLLVSLRPLKQLKIDSCYFPLARTITQAREL